MTKTYDEPDDQLRYDMALDAAADLVLRITQIKDSGAREVIGDLTGRINWLLSTFDLYDEDGVFTFPDGDMWRNEHHIEPLPEPWLDKDNDTPSEAARS